MSEERPALTPPAKIRDPRWQERIERAKEARAAGQQLRRGRQVSFADQRVNRRVQD